MNHYLISVIALFLAIWNLRADDTNSSPRHATAVGEAVQRLLETRDPDAFARALAVANPYSTKEVADSAQLVLDQAARSGLEPPRVHFRVKEVLAKATGTGKNPDKADGEMLPTSFGIKIIMLGEPARDSGADKRFLGEYELALGGSFEFPDGWRTYEGVRWSRFPEGVADERTRLDVLLVSNIVSRPGAPLRLADDPALAALGNTLIHFLQQRDEKVFANETMRSFNEVWDALLKKLNASGVKPLPSRNDFRDSWNMMRGQKVDSARGVLAQADTLGLDFSTAEITLKDGSADFPYMRGGYGSVDGITSESLHFTISVNSNLKSKSGHPIEGDYTLAIRAGQRSPTRWTIEDKIRWEKFPDGLLGEKGLADLDFENYVSEHGALPPGTSVPDVQLVRLDNETTVKLSDFRGQVVVLEWWATWCGPCQGPMADLQTLQGQHSEWKDRVKIIALSINDEPREAQDHLVKHNWTNTFNLWAGPGGWMSDASKQFRLHGVPTCYVIDAQGKVVLGGSPPPAPQLTSVIAGLLK